MPKSKISYKGAIYTLAEKQARKPIATVLVYQEGDPNNGGVGYTVELEPYEDLWKEYGVKPTATGQSAHAALKEMAENWRRAGFLD